MSEPHAATPLTVPLADASRYGPAVVGAKAHALSRLLAAGAAVPDGFVVTARAQHLDDEARRQISAAVRALGSERMAVRSSAAEEDLAGASFAGQYDTVLDVTVEQVPGALRRVFASAAGARVSAYRGAPTTHVRMAVLVQRMVPADAAGVAFTANPLTGRRDETIVTAVRGSGERLVSGEVDGETWVVRGTDAVADSPANGAIDAARAVAVARLARRAEAHMGAPSDIEWALSGATLHLLQARPMTALPDEVPWDPPGPGRWMRNFRLGEWLPDPMTPLFATWLLPRLDAGLHAAMRRTAGAVLPFRSAAINGWYYTALPHPPAARLLAGLVRSRGRLLLFAFNAVIRVNWRPDAADRALLGRLARQWRDEHLPAYRTRVAAAGARTATAGDRELERIVDDLGRAAGEQLWWLELLGGAAWKMEACLARFADRHLTGVLDSGVQVLLAGLGRLPSAVPDHAVQSLDWYHATAGELQPAAAAVEPPARQRAVARRQRAEQACRAALADQPARRRRFDALLGVARRYALLREAQAEQLTLAWPVLRACALRLGAGLCSRGVVDRAEDVFFLRHRELRAGTDRREDVRVRRDAWQRQRRLIAPLTVGAAPRLAPDVVAAAVARMAGRAGTPAHAIVGQPASPGRATGVARVVLDPQDVARFEAGEVLVARTTAPAWTPLLARAVAVVTDGGSLAAHASLIAREYGIPAVVATGDATTRLRTGQPVTVDGNTGAVTPAPGGANVAGSGR